MSTTPAAAPGPGRARLAATVGAWIAGGTALVGGAMLFARRERHGPLAQPVGHNEPQHWDHDEHGADTGRGRPLDPPDAASREAGYEIADVTTSNIRWTMLLYAVVALASVFGMIAMLRMFRADDVASQPRLTATQTAPIEVPGPHIQVDAYGDLNRERGREIGKITGYAWTNAARTEAHIPIEAAMAEVVGRPLDTPGLTRFDRATDRAGSQAGSSASGAATAATPGAPGTASGSEPGHGR